MQNRSSDFPTSRVPSGSTEQLQKVPLTESKDQIPALPQKRKRAAPEGLSGRTGY